MTPATNRFLSFGRKISDEKNSNIWSAISRFVICCCTDCSVLWALWKMECLFHWIRLHFILRSRHIRRIDFDLFSKSPNFKNSMVFNFARLSAGLAYCLGDDARWRFARLHWRVGLSTNPLDAVCVAGRAGRKFYGKEMIIGSYASYDG